MNIKKLFNKKTIIISLLFVLSLTLFAVLNISTTYASAESETLEQKIVRFTSSDLLDGEQEGGTDIRSFAQKYKNDEYRAGYTGSYPITSIISKVLPLELFYTEGAHVYMGSEYGFIVYTYTNNSGVSYFSQFLIIDFTFSLAHDKYGTAVTNQPTYRMETLIQQFVEVTRENETSDWNVIQPQSRLGTDIYLKNVYIAANLENENELNFYDSYYDKQKDNGDVILYAGIDYCAHTQVGSVNFEPLLTWGIDFVVTKTAEMNPITDKALSFVEDASSFINAVGEIYNVNDVTYSTIGSESRLQFSNLSKDEQKSNSNYTSYAREVYVKQSDLNNAATAEFVPGMNCDDENSFIELQVITAGLPVNSRISFSVGFEAVFKQVGSANFIKTEDGGYDVLPDDYPNSTPAILTHSIDYKIQNASIKKIKSVNYVDNQWDEIADGMAYLLNKNGYQIYEFQPQAEGELDEQFIFGDYCFYTNSIMGLQPSTRIHLFKSNGGSGKINPKELCLLSREELISHPYLLAYNNQGTYDDMWKLKYTFTNNVNTDNLYYVLYTYSFDYLGGSSYFEAEYDFIPTELNLNGENTTFYSGASTELYFRAIPSTTGNYTISIQGVPSATLYLYESQVGNTRLKESYSNSVLDVLLKKGKTYYIRINNITTNTSGIINIFSGEEIENYQTSLSGIGSNETKYYKFIPTEFSGKYDVDVVDGINVLWYDSNLEQLNFDSKGNTFLSKNSTYYLKVYNVGAVSLSSNITINYLYENTFNSILKIVTEGHRQYYAYVIEGANVSGMSLSIVVNFNGHSIYNNTIISSDNDFVLPINLTSVNFISGTNTINASIIVNENTLNPASVPMQEIYTTYSTLDSTSYSAEYVYFYCTSRSFSSKVVYIPDTVKMLIVNNASTVNLTGVYFDIAESENPLIIHFNSASALTIKAPVNISVINSSRDIVLNCKGIVSLYGGNGIDNEFYVDLDGDPAICAHNNTVVLNGAGTLKLYGGDGGNTYGQEFYNIDPAGNGGTAIEVKNLVINVGGIYIKGGAGGNGGVGTQGSNGVDGISAGSNGTDGGNGGYGGDGGSAGMGVWVLGNYCAIYTSNIQMYGGVAGNGGLGGRGGNGGNGADGSRYGNGGNGGDAGNGGMGGDYGTGMIAFNSYDINKIKYYNSAGGEISLPTNLKTMFETWSSDGMPGVGGNPGTPGKGGKGGSGFLGIGAGSNGYNGSPGIQGGSGGNPNPHIYAMTISASIVIRDTTEDYNDNDNLSIVKYIIRRIGGERAYELYGIGL